MINSWFNENSIYSPKIRLYFREVISSYNNENFRSAIVMLYSTVISDLIIKLQALRDTDGDKKATRILSEIESKRISKSSLLITSALSEWPTRMCLDIFILQVPIL